MINSQTRINRILGPNKLKRRVRQGEVINFSIDLVMAEMVNLTNESSNPWDWKKGEKLHQWTNNNYFEIVSVDKYPGSGIKLKRTTG